MYFSTTTYITTVESRKVLQLVLLLLSALSSIRNWPELQNTNSGYSLHSFSTGSNLSLLQSSLKNDVDGSIVVKKKQPFINHVAIFSSFDNFRMKYCLLTQVNYIYISILTN